MSAIADNLRRQRMPLLVTFFVVVAGAAAWVIVSQTTAHHLTRPEYPTAAPAIEQAKWKVDVEGRGRDGKLSKSQAARFDKEKGDVADVVTNVYDAIFLDPASFGKLLSHAFTAQAAKSLDVRKLGFPAGATDVKTLRRSADIGIDIESADFAVARVKIEAQATVNSKTVKVVHHSTLWLERDNNEWEVIAFDVEQGPKK